MSYKEIFKIALLLISSPAKAWEEIRLEEDKRKVFTAFVYPMIGFCALAVFLGSLFANGWGGHESFQIAMRNCCITAVSLFGGYFLAAYIINELGMKVFSLPDNMPLVYQFAGYAMVVIFLTEMLTGLFPGFFLLAIILQFYVVYIVWEGAPVLMRIKEELKLKYVLSVSFILVACPFSIHWVFNRLLVLLN